MVLMLCLLQRRYAGSALSSRVIIPVVRAEVSSLQNVAA